MIEQRKTEQKKTTQNTKKIINTDTTKNTTQKTTDTTKNTTQKTKKMINTSCVLYQIIAIIVSDLYMSFNLGNNIILFYSIQFYMDNLFLLGLSLILLIINLVAKNSLCIVSKVQREQ
jgi:hypothetical protein